MITNISLDNNLNAKDIGPGMCLVRSMDKN